MIQPRARLWMNIATDTLDPSVIANSHASRKITKDDAVALGHLMDRSYRASVDYEGETLDQCITEMTETIDGKYGPFIADASFVLENAAGEIISASLVTTWRGKPLLAYSMTDPKHQGHGLAKQLIEKSIVALHVKQESELFLVVTEANTPAMKLYESIGFQVLGEALRGQPPPVTPLRSSVHS